MDMIIALIRGFTLSCRTTRESTPCSLIRDPNNIQTPGSSTRPNNASEANGGGPNSPQLIIPTAHEMKGFFAAEKKQQREFIEKYGFSRLSYFKY